MIFLVVQETTDAKEQQLSWHLFLCSKFQRTKRKQNRYLLTTSKCVQIKSKEKNRRRTHGCLSNYFRSFLFNFIEIAFYLMIQFDRPCNWLLNVCVMRRLNMEFVQSWKLCKKRENKYDERLVLRAHRTFMWLNLERFFVRGQNEFATNTWFERINSDRTVNR